MCSSSSGGQIGYGGANVSSSSKLQPNIRTNEALAQVMRPSRDTAASPGRRGRSLAWGARGQLGEAPAEHPDKRGAGPGDAAVERHRRESRLQRAVDGLAQPELFAQ